MNLRRILQGLSLCLFFALCSSETQAQAQLAGVNQDGLIQLGANHPFVVNQYVLDIASLNLSDEAAANLFFAPYITEGFMRFTYDFSTQKAFMFVDAGKVSDVQLPVAKMNQKLSAIHRIKR